MTVSANHPETLDALKLAAAAWLRSYCDLTEEECAVTPDGRPHPGAGQRFVAVHGGRVTSNSAERLDEYASFTVTVTVRTGETPQDRLKSEGKDLVRKVKAAIHGTNGYSLTALATASDPEVVFVEPPKFLSEGDAMPKGADWFFSEETEDATTGLATELQFGKARRIRYNSDLDDT